MGKIFMGYWDCSYCGNKHIHGNKRECPGCGKPRGDDVRFYMDGTSQEVENPESINKNPDWLCPFCGSLNSDSMKTCSSCGHGREESDPDYFDKEKCLNRMTMDNGMFDRDTSISGGFEDLIYEQDSYKKKEKRRKKIITAAIIAGVLLLCAALLFVFLPRTKMISVEEVGWERNVEVEVYRTVSDSGWTLPSGAHDVTQRQEIQSYNQVLDHYETKTREKSRQVQDGYDVYYSYRDLGNGYFEQVEHKTPRYRTEYYTETYQDPVYRSVPVYATKYYYDIERWVFDRSEKTSGVDKSPYFARIDTRDGIRREGNTSEKYWIIDENGKTYSIEYDLWETLNVGDSVKIKTTIFGKILSIEKQN